MKLLAVAVATAGCLTCSFGQREEQAALLNSGNDEDIRPLNVAIIGAGAGGASSAYHLNKFATAAGLPINITVFERNSSAGGRSTTVNAYDDPRLPIELGGSIFVKVNQILNDAVEEFNLSTASFSSSIEVPGADLVVWNGHTFVVVMQNAGWWDSAKMIWKYGLAPIKTIRLMRSTVGKFLQMYKAPIFPFESLNQAAEELGLLEVTAATGEQFMAENGITGNFGRDVVQASTRVNYATNLNHIHGLEAMVCMAAEGGMAVQGGNWQIFDSMIGASDATTLFNTEVTSMNKERGGRYAVTFEGAGSDLAMQATTQQFDSVILAAPNQFANVDITPRLQHMPDKIPYVKLHVTLFTSPHLLSSAFFGLPANKPAPRAILTTLPKDEKPLQGKQSVGSPGFFSISLLHAVTNPNTGGQEYAYKIFSTSPPNSTFLTQLLGLNQPQEYSAGEIDAESGVSSKDITWMYRKIWSSYPYEYPRVTFEPFKLDDNLWYTSAIESFISTMETSALAGMNVARLVMDKWREELGAVKYGMMLEKEMIGREAGDV